MSRALFWDEVRPWFHEYFHVDDGAGLGACHQTGSTGLSAKLVTEDALAHHDGPYDAILLDAPCTASGTIRRHPDLAHAKRWTEVEPLTRLQMQLIDHALTLLAPGGRLVFCTCSLLPVEGEHQVTAALKRHGDLRVIPADAVALGGDPTWQSPEGGLRLRPGGEHQHRGHPHHCSSQSLEHVGTLVH